MNAVGGNMRSLPTPAAFLIGMMFLAAIFFIGPPASSAGTDDDPLAPFLRDLADSTDAYFGRSAAPFDTTGNDSLIRVFGSEPPVPGEARHRKAGIRMSPVIGFHRATGQVVGLDVATKDLELSRIDARLSCGLSNKEGRYRLDARRAIALIDSGGGRGGLRIEAAYSRETLPFAPEHASPLQSEVGAFFTGRDRQDVFERRCGSLGLSLTASDFTAGAGWRFGRDQSMPRATRFTLWGADRAVPLVTPATEGYFSEGFSEFSSDFRHLPRLGAQTTYAGRDRWRSRIAAAEDFDPFGFKLNLQMEVGAAAAKGPSQDRFELGGPYAVPSMGYGDESGNRLAFGKIELAHGLDLLKALRIPHPSMVVLHPAVFMQEGAAWTASDGRWAVPPDESWRAAAGISLLHLPGIISPSTYVRMQMAWSIRKESGVPRFTLSIGRWDDLVPGR
jgi:hypothetical protein